MTDYNIEETKPNNDFPTIYEYFLSRDYNEWLKRLFIYPLDYQSKKIAYINEDMGLDYVNLRVFVKVIKDFLNENKSDDVHCYEDTLRSTYNILEGSSFINLEVIEYIKDDKISYLVSTSCNADIITKKTIGLNRLEEYAYDKLNSKEIKKVR